MQTPKIVIEVRGGVVENVFSNMAIEYILVDHDNIALEDPDDFDLSPIEPDAVSTNLETVFADEKGDDENDLTFKRRLRELLRTYGF